MSLSSISALVITHLTPRRIASLKEVLRRRAGASPQLEVYLSNPAVQALRSNLSKFIRADLSYCHPSHLPFEFKEVLAVS